MKLAITSKTCSYVGAGPARGHANERDANRLSVMSELQADCYAGKEPCPDSSVEPGDVEEGLKAAAAIVMTVYATPAAA
jgi:predicted metalloprotease